MLQHVSDLHSLLWLSRILFPLYISTFCLWVVHPFMDIGLLPMLGYCEYCYYKHWYSTFYVDIYFHFSWVYNQKPKLDNKVTFMGSHLRSKQYCFSSLPGVYEGFYFSMYPVALTVFDCSGESRWVWSTLSYWLAFSWWLTMSTVFSCVLHYLCIFLREMSALSLNPLFKLEFIIKL